MHFVDRSYDEPRWAGLVRLAAGGVFALLFCAAVLVDVFWFPAHEGTIAMSFEAAAPACDTTGSPDACGMSR